MSTWKNKLPALGICAAVLLISSACSKQPDSAQEQEFSVIEISIDDVHEAFRAGTLTSRELVEIYLDRIEKYDQSTKMNSLVVLNSNALKRADELDAEFRETGKLRPLHGIPIIVKDNYETFDLQTTAGSEALLGFIPPDDAFQVKRLREAGAIVLAKSNMGEWAFSPLETFSSTAGMTRNPYDLNRVPAGSSGGTAAAVAANLGLAGLGTDTGNSIRGPSSHCCLVGFRSTMGLTSRDGIIPLYLRNDVGGPMCRTVADAARILSVIAGYDPADPITEYGRGKTEEDYTRFLDPEGLKGARIGVFRLYTDLPTADEQVLALFEAAIEDMKLQGAVIVDPFMIPDFGRLTKSIWCDTFRHDLNNYLASLGEHAPVKSLTEVYNKGNFATKNKRRILRALEIPLSADPACRDLFSEPKNIAFRDAVLKTMEDQNVDFIIYPTWNNPPRLLGDQKNPAGDNSQMIPPHTGMPAFTIPMGFTYDDLPAGLQIVGKMFSEAEMIRVAYAYEQATRHRRPPEKFK